ncbi:hypothetical protein CXG81DRAFT_2243, partial [Caulochytrium protostelioides]
THTTVIPLEYDGKTENIPARVLPTAPFDMVLGRSWLKRHNPNVDWVTGIITLN